MSNPFERHGIGHLSASSLNLWAAEPALWIMERLLGRRAPSGIPAARGKAVEAGVNLGLHDPVLSVEACKVIAHELLVSLKGSVSVDWSHRESARARMRVLVKRILRKHGYPPDLQDAAVQTVLRQAEALSANWSQ